MSNAKKRDIFFPFEGNEGKEILNKTGTNETFRTISDIVSFTMARLCLWNEWQNKTWIVKANESRNIMQWVACVTMVLDHLGYIFENPVLRIIGRVAMPYYCMLFVLTGRQKGYNTKRLLLLSAISQVPFMLLFEMYRLNIIFGFWIFSELIESVKKENTYKIIITSIAIIIVPVDYGYYLYLTLFAFWISGQVTYQIINIFYTYISGAILQLFACFAWYIPKAKVSRIPSLEYRWFYPAHLVLLLWLQLIFQQ